VGGESKVEIDRLRARAGSMGITIRTQRAKKPSDRRAYSLIDRATGKVLHDDVAGLIDLEARLVGITWDRQLARADTPPATSSASVCPSCGTRRIGQFRWCRSCGRDFEPTSHTIARVPAFTDIGPDAMPSGPEPATGPLSGSGQESAPHSSSGEARDTPMPTVGPGPRPASDHRLTLQPQASLLARYRLQSAREIAVGAAIGLLVGVFTAVLMSMR
jgi:hypothetical protein